jgi:ribulose kinase
MPELVAAVDVGTGSARAGIFDAMGRMLGRGEAAIDTHSAAALYAEQDSAQLWAAVGRALAAARAEAGAGPDAIAGLAFDATCSLVVRDGRGEPVPASVGQHRYRVNVAGIPGRVFV